MLIMPPDGAGKIEDIAWEQDWIHMSRHFRVASPKKITVWRQAENCNYLRNAMWRGGGRGQLYWSDKTKKENEIAKLRQSEQIKQQICMRYIYGSCSGVLRVAMIANFILLVRVAIASTRTAGGGRGCVLPIYVLADRNEISLYAT